MSSNESNVQGGDLSTSEFADLSGFRRDLLIVVAGLDTPKGLDIKEELEKYYENEIHHGRLYPNLDTLVEVGFVEKISIDKRSNGYILTDQGEAHLNARFSWERRKVNGAANGEDQFTWISEKTVVESKPGGVTSETESQNQRPNKVSKKEQQQSEESEKVTHQTSSNDMLSEIEKEFENVSADDAGEKEK